jgi:HSP20 family protein
MNNNNSELSELIRWFLAMLGFKNGVEIGNGPSEKGTLADVIATDKEVRVILELPSVDAEDVKVDVRKGVVEISAETSKKKYHHEIKLPSDASVQAAKTTFKNGILEIIYQKEAGSENNMIKME